MSNTWHREREQREGGAWMGKSGLDRTIRMMLKRYFRTGRAPGRWGRAIADECRRVMPGMSDPSAAPSYLLDRVVANLSDRSRKRWLGAGLASSDAETVRC